MGSDDPTAADERLVVGGTQTINNIEIESPIVKAAGLRAVVFVDAGNAFGDSGAMAPLTLRIYGWLMALEFAGSHQWVLFALSGASRESLP